MRIVVSLCALLALPTVLLAQAGRPPARGGMPPVMMAEVGGQSAPLRISEVETAVRILGHVAETSSTLTFTSSHGEELEGNFVFPLPKDATVSGYALDIRDKMVDGVAVSNTYGSEVFDDIIRRRIDPGLMEWAGNNTFKTRVYPIPAGGQRKIRVDYVQEIIGDGTTAAYRLPLRFDNRLDRFSLSIKVEKASQPPRLVQDALLGLNFENDQGVYVAKTELQGFAPNGQVVLNLAQTQHEDVLVEKTADGEYFFCVRGVPPSARSKTAIVNLQRFTDPNLIDQEPAAVEKRIAPRRVVVYWDASGSRHNDDHAREMAVLRRYFESMLSGKPKSQPGILVDLVMLRESASEPRQIVLRDRDMTDLVTPLRMIGYDGATSLSAVKPVSGGGTPPDFYILVSDGFSNFGDGIPKGLDAPVFALSSKPEANHPLLHRLALATGGRYLNLSWLHDFQAAAAIGLPPQRPLQPNYFDHQVKDVTFNSPMTAPDQVSAYGKLVSADTTMTFDYNSYHGGSHNGLTGSAKNVRSFQISKSDAVEGTLLQRLWAQHRLLELLPESNRNREEITDLGKQFGLVTPYTSLIVLDSLSQYVQYGIEPPVTMPQMRQQYHQQRGARVQSPAQLRTNKLNQIAPQWSNRVQWLNRKFSYPSNFSYAAYVRAERARRYRNSMSLAGMPVFGGSPSGFPQGKLGGSFPTRGVMGMGGMGGMSGGMGMGGMSGGGMGGMAMGGMGGGMASPQPVVTPVTTASSPSAGLDANLAADLKNLASVPGQKLFLSYMPNKNRRFNMPTFYLDRTERLADRGKNDLAVRSLSNLVEIHSSGAASGGTTSSGTTLPRVMAHYLERLGRVDDAVEALESLLRQFPKDQHVKRDLALMLAQRAEKSSQAAGNKDLTPQAAADLTNRCTADYARALQLLNDAILESKDPSDTFSLVTAMDANRLSKRAEELGVTSPLDAQLSSPLRCDLRIVLTVISNNADVVLTVTEPSGEIARRRHNTTITGGFVSADPNASIGRTQEYFVGNAMRGDYRLAADVVKTHKDEENVGIVVRADVYANFGGAGERHWTTIRRMKHKEASLSLGRIRSTSRVTHFALR